VLAARRAEAFRHVGRLAQGSSARTTCGRELGEFQPQVSFPDFNMPQFDAWTALAIARESAPKSLHLRFRTLGEETPSARCRNGATDYCPEDNLVRLPPAVERALAEANARAQRKARRGAASRWSTPSSGARGRRQRSAGLKRDPLDLPKPRAGTWARYFRVDEKSRVLALRGRPVPAPAALEEFVEGSREMTFAPGVGLTGRVWQLGGPLWSTDTRATRAWMRRISRTRPRSGARS